jgi:hypothetical protein
MGSCLVEGTLGWGGLSIGYKLTPLTRFHIRLKIYLPTETIGSTAIYIIEFVNASMSSPAFATFQLERPSGKDE